MTPFNKKEYIITEKRTGKVIHEGADRRSILPNAADFRTQIIITIVGVVLTGLLTILGWCGDMAYHGLASDIERIYQHMSVGRANSDNQIDYIYRECCQNAKSSPPTELPQ